MRSNYFSSLLFCLIVTQASAETTLRLASFVSAKSPVYKEVIKPWADEINRLAAGEINIAFFPGGSLGRHPNLQLKLLKDGVQDITLIVPSYTPGQFPDDDLFELPLLLDNTMEATLSYSRMIEAGYLRGYDELKVIAVFMSLPYYFHLDTPYQQFEDLAGKKIRVTGFIQAKIIESLNATPVGGIPATQIRENISRGLIDGTILGWDSMHIFGVKHATSHHIELPVTFTPILIAMNMRSYQNLSPALRHLIDRHSGETLSRALVVATSRLGTKTRREMRSTPGQTFITPQGEDQQKWLAALQPFTQKWIEKNPNGRERMAAFRRILDTIRREESAGNP